MEVVICDDEKELREDIKARLIRYSQMNTEFTFNISEYSSGEELLRRAEPIDILFMDIEMEGINGIDTAKKIKEENNGTILIFVTSFSRYAPETFRVGAFQLLLKPVGEKEFVDDLNRALIQYKRYHMRFVARYKGSEVVLKFKDIIYLDFVDRHVVVHTVKGDYPIVSKLSDVEEEFCLNGFVRIHQGYIVNMKYIRKIGLSDVELKGGTILPLSKSRHAEALDRFNQYLLWR